MIPTYAAYQVGYAETALLLLEPTPEAVEAYGTAIRDALRLCPEVARHSLNTVRTYPAVVALLSADIQAEVSK